MCRKKGRRKKRCTWGDLLSINKHKHKQHISHRGIGLQSPPPEYTKFLTMF
jgi:hypothetical protein